MPIFLFCWGVLEIRAILASASAFWTCLIHPDILHSKHKGIAVDDAIKMTLESISEQLITSTRLCYNWNEFPGYIVVLFDYIVDRRELSGVT